MQTYLSLIITGLVFAEKQYIRTELASRPGPQFTFPIDDVVTKATALTTDIYICTDVEIPH